MSRIVHLALRVDDLERTTQFYTEVFGFAEMNTDKVRDHTSRHLSDGTIDLALIQYDAGLFCVFRIGWNGLRRSIFR